MKPRLVSVARSTDGTWAFNPGGGCGWRGGFETEEAAKAVALQVAGPDPDFFIAVCAVCGERGGVVFAVGDGWPMKRVCGSCK